MSEARLNLVVLRTRQMEQLLCFYRTLAVELIEEQHGKGPIHHAGLVGDVVFEIYPLPDEACEADAKTRLGFTVVLGAVRNLGAVVVAEPKLTRWGLRAVVLDPDRRSVELYQSEADARSRSGTSDIR